MLRSKFNLLFTIREKLASYHLSFLVYKQKGNLVEIRLYQTKFPAQLENKWESKNLFCNVRNLYLSHLLARMQAKLSFENNLGFLLSMHENIHYLENWEACD